MEVIDFPLDRIGGAGTTRAASRLGPGLGPRLRVVAVRERGAQSSFCARCAAPIDFAPVVRGAETFCSVECSLGDGRPA